MRRAVAVAGLSMLFWRGRAPGAGTAGAVAELARGPNELITVVDGKARWVYSPELRQYARWPGGLEGEPGLEMRTIGQLTEHMTEAGCFDGDGRPVSR